MPGDTHPGYEHRFERIEMHLERADILIENLAHGMTVLTARMEELTLKGAETEDKLNGLISLVDRHIREHHRDQ